MGNFFNLVLKVGKLAALVGAVGGVIYLLSKIEKHGDSTPNPEKKKQENEASEAPNEEEVSDTESVLEEMQKTKNKSSQEVQDRHKQAAEIMKNAYGNIMEDFVEDISVEKNKDVIPEEVTVDNATEQVMSNTNDIADELDKLFE